MNTPHYDDYGDERARPEREPSEDQADEKLAEADPDPQHAAPGEASEDQADTRPPRDVDNHPGDLPPTLPDPDEDALCPSRW